MEISAVQYYKRKTIKEFWNPLRWNKYMLTLRSSSLCKLRPKSCAHVHLCIRWIVLGFSPNRSSRLLSTPRLMVFKSFLSLLFYWVCFHRHNYHRVHRSYLVESRRVYSTLRTPSSSPRLVYRSLDLTDSTAHNRLVVSPKKQNTSLAYIIYFIQIIAE